MNQKTLFIIGAALILSAFIIATLLFQAQKTAPSDAPVNQGLGVLERYGAAVKGPTDAKVTIVEFFDPACGTCADFYPLLQQLVDQYPGKVKVMARYAPLHQGSDQVVMMLEAAHQQGYFWPALELLFSNQRHWVINHVSQPVSARTILNSLDLDQQKLTADMNSGKVMQVIEKDIQDGQALNIRATPEFFVNGRPMPSFGYEQLRQLVKEAVADAY